MKQESYTPSVPDRGEAVNLARTLRATGYIDKITRRGILKLVSAVLNMDEFIRYHSETHADIVQVLPLKPQPETITTVTHGGRPMTLLECAEAEEPSPIDKVGLTENDEPLRELCFDYRNAQTTHAENYFQRIVRWVRMNAVRESFAASATRDSDAIRLLRTIYMSWALHGIAPELEDEIKALLARTDSASKDNT